MLKYPDKNSLMENGPILADNSRYHLTLRGCENLKLQEPETASHIHSQEQTENECILRPPSQFLYSLRPELRE